jgi:hypothetical protein
MSSDAATLLKRTSLHLDRQNLLMKQKAGIKTLSSKVIHINCNIAPLALKTIIYSLQYMLTRMSVLKLYIERNCGVLYIILT